MPEYPAGSRKRPPTHPGQVIADVLDTLRVSTRHAAHAMHVSPMALGNVIAGETKVSPKMALRLGKLLGNGAEIWLRMQQDYDLWHASREMGAELAEIKPISDAA
jgi:addiction module HigA family antidote